MRRPLTGLSLVVALSAAWPTAGRAGGIDLGGVGTRSVARGHAVVAGGDDPSLSLANPGLLSLLKGTRAMLTFSPVFDPEKYRRAPIYDTALEGPNIPPPVRQYEEVENLESPMLLSGLFMGVTSDLGLENWVFAATVSGPNSMGHTRYPVDGPQRYQLVEKDILLAVYTLSAAYGTEDFGVGASLHWMDLSKSKLSMVVDADNKSTIVYPHESPYDVLVTLDTADRFSLTGSIGGWYRPIKGVTIAVSGRVVPPSFDAVGDIKLEGQGSIVEGRTFRTGREVNGQWEDDATTHFRFDLAPTANLGVRYAYGDEAAPTFDVELDVAWEGWSALDGYEVGLPPNARVDELNLEVDLSDLTVERRWQDMWIVRLGGSYDVLPGLLELHAGGFYESGAVPEAYTYLDFLSFQRVALGLGGTIKLGDAELDLAWQHIFNEPRAISEDEGKMYQQRPASACQAPYTGENCDPRYQGQSGATANAGTFLSGYDVFSLSLGYRFL